METAWRFRIMLFMAFTMILFGDMLGYGNVNNSKNKNSITNSNENNAGESKEQEVDTTLKTNRHKIDGKLFGCKVLLFLYICFSGLLAWSACVDTKLLCWVGLDFIVLVTFKELHGKRHCPEATHSLAFARNVRN